MVWFKIERIMSWDSSERREFVRIQFPCEIVLPGSEEKIISTKAENISAGGIRVMLKEELYPASLVNLDIYGIKENPITCVGKIIWVFKRELHHSEPVVLYDTGIEFHEIQKEDIDAIKKLIASIASGKNE